jgi:hypothetical protein
MRQEDGMIDRQKLETVLSRRFPGASAAQIAAAANSIMGLEDEWEEIGTPDDFGFSFSSRCADICALARETEAGAELRILRRRE